MKHAGNGGHTARAKLGRLGVGALSIVFALSQALGLVAPAVPAAWAEPAAEPETVTVTLAAGEHGSLAIAGEDANWGRVVAAVGKSGAKADRDLLTIRFGDMVLAENGWRAPSYDEEKASAYMKRDELVIGVDLGLGRAARTVWTCDLTHRYIDINADYRS